MDLYSLITNIKTAELVFNLAIQIVAVSLAGWAIMSLWKPRSAPARSAGYLTILVSLAILPVISTVFNLNGITWLQPTIELPQSYARQSSPGNFQALQKFPEEKIIVNNETPVIRQDTFNKNGNFNPETVLETDHQRREASTGNEQQENPRPSDKNHIPFVTGDLILLLANIFGIIWIAGFIIFILRLGFKLSFLKGYMYNLNTGNIERLKNIYNSIKHVFNDKPIPDIYFSSSLSSPVTIGILKPVMILPVEMENISDDDLKSILLHEFAHIFHRDNFIGFLQHVLSSIFWWNPFVYFLNASYSDSREDVCDNYAINVLKSPKKYANTLLSLAEKTHLLSHMPATAGMSLSRRSFEHRVLDLLRKDRDLSTIYKPSLIILSLIAAIVITSCGTGMKLSFKDSDYYYNEAYFKFSKKPVWVIGNDIINKINAGEFIVIEKYIDRLVNKKPYTVDGTRVLEKLYQFVSDRLESRDMLDKWCAKEPSHHSAFIFRGNYYIGQAWKHRGSDLGYTVTEERSNLFKENLLLAEKDFNKAWSMSPADPNSSAFMLTVYKGLKYNESEKDIWFNRAIAADPVAYYAYAKKQDYLRPKWGGTKEKDLDFAEYCDKNAPPKSVIHEIMLDYIMEKARWEKRDFKIYYQDPVIKNKIDDIAQRTLENFPNSTSIRDKLAEIETSQGNYEKAAELYTEILEKDPGNPNALHKRARLYAVSLKKPDLAEKDINKSLESDPGGPDIYDDLAMIAALSRNFEKTIGYYNHAIKRNPNSKQLYLLRGSALIIARQDYLSAVEDFKNALRLDPLLIQAYHLTAQCYEKLNRPEEAKKYIQMSMAITNAQKSRGNVRPIRIPPQLAGSIEELLDISVKRYPSDRNYFNGKNETLTNRKKMPVKEFPGGLKGGTLKVVVDMPHFSGLNAGSNAVDENDVNRAVSDLLVLDNTGKKSVILHMNGKDTFFEGGTVLTVYCNVWKGDQSNEDYKYNGRKTVTIDGNTTITFIEDGYAQSYLHNKQIVPEEIFSQYAGTYKLDPDMNVMIRVLNGRLILQLTGQPVVALSQESDVIFFHRILKTGVEFFKDQSGNITHLMLTQDGIEKKAVRTSNKVIDKNAVILTADTLSQYVGTYKMHNLDLMITMEGNQLFAQFPGLMLKALFPESETLFFDNIIDTRLEFFKDKGGKVTHLVFTQGNVGITAPRVEEATTAPQIERGTASAPDNYGLTEKTAIKTGGGPKGEHDYLNMLCGPNGEKIKFKRLGSCCAFETPNSPFNNTGLLDKYEVTYEGLKEPVIVYLNMYDPPTGEFFAPIGFIMKNSRTSDTSKTQPPINEDKNKIIIDIQKENEIWVEGETVDLNSIKSRIENFKNKYPEGNVIITCNKDCFNKKVIEMVLEQVRAAKVNNVVVAASKEE